MNYALIENGIVVNVISIHPMNADDFPNAVPVGDYPAGIGDTYENGVFYRDGKALKTSADLRDEMADMHSALAELGVTVDES